MRLLNRCRKFSRLAAVQRWCSEAGLVVALHGGAALLLGPKFAAETNNLLMSLPNATNRLLSVFHLGSMSDLFKDGATVSTLGGLASRVIAWTSTAAGALASLLLVIFGGFSWRMTRSFTAKAS